MSNPVSDPTLGEITVFREYLPRDDEIEYTVHYRVDGERKRHDMRVKSADLENFDGQEENFIRNKLVAEIDKKEGGYFTKMHESKPLRGLEEPEEKEFEAVLESTGPTETELVMVSLLMRLYDLNLAILSHLDQKRADEIFDAHAKGEHFNPPIFIPESPDAD